MNNLAYQPGKYRGRIVSYGLGENNQSNPQWVTTFTILGEYQGGELRSCAQMERTIYRVITNATINFVVRDLKAVGYPFDTFDQLDPEHPGTFDMRNQEIDVQCKHDTYEGKTREKWEFAFGGGVQMKAMDRKGVSKLNALFGKELKAAGAASAPGPMKAKAPAANGAGATTATTEKTEKTTEEQAEEIF